MAFERKFLEDSEIKTYTMPDGTKYSPSTIVIDDENNYVFFYTTSDREPPFLKYFQMCIRGVWFNITTERLVCDDNNICTWKVSSVYCETKYNETEVFAILKKALIEYRNGAHENMFTKNDTYVVEY